MAGGRPTKYKKQYCKELVAYMAKGHSLTAYAGHTGISRETFYQWAKEKPEFSDAIRKGRQACQQFYENFGIAAASGKIKGFNATAYVWLTKNIIGWKDKIEHVNISDEESQKKEGYKFLEPDEK